jgi:hypothetical protein
LRTLVLALASHNYFGRRRVSQNKYNITKHESCVVKCEMFCAAAARAIRLETYLL